MQQHLMQMQPMVSAYYPNNVTTDHIQQYLDENKSLILKIVESQNSGKWSECAENQARLQRNLMYLAAIADSQPQPPAVHPQRYYAARIRTLHAASTNPTDNAAITYGLTVGISSGGSTGLSMLQSEASTGGGSGGFPDFAHGGGRAITGGSKQDITSAGESAEGRGGSSGVQYDDGGQALYLK
ncbi:hypothetical protein GOBAR_AA01324 [Gossypium barbadense]|uniref:SS18 N-terminal domain-containing protein n=1 Tax=Gossypium barbadense TaxID=3634 RepID=A0A2P5YUH9_GOSBA|nr:hypothetical protein GOBAR_AA01324 [Gossypium barbadense]